jgi:cytoskeletal protein CcmA (bactofilin family)
MRESLGGGRTAIAWGKGGEGLSVQMQSGAKSWNDVRGKGFFVAVLIAFLGAYFGNTAYYALTAKTPGESHCYGGVCHRVFSLEETRRLIGKSTEVIATHYDAPGVDKYNTGQYTSSGEEFDAENAARAAAVHYPDGTELLIWHPGTRRAAHIRVNDFGPFMGKRTLDVTRKVADTMGWAKNGVATLKATVIWVPQPSDPTYKKNRAYPPSLGLIGVVEDHQYDALADRLIITGPARNGLVPGPTMPDVPAVLAAAVRQPPRFRSEGVEDADDREQEQAVAIAKLMAQLPKFEIAELPISAPAAVAAIADTAAPLFRTEAVANAAWTAAAEREALTRTLASLPEPRLATDLPAELSPPVVIAAVQPAAPTVPAAAVTVPVNETRADTGSPLANRSTPQREAGSASASPPSQVAESAPVEPVDVKPEAAPAAASVETPAAVVTVASAQASSVLRSWTPGQIGLWIGIGLMLSTLWGARSLNRTRRNGAVVAAPYAPETFEVTASSSDPLAVARLAAEKAEARARVAFAAEQASAAASEAELQAREDLARELALREFEREQEASARARAEAAAAAHVEAQRALATLEADRAARRTRTAEVERQNTALAARPVAAAQISTARAPVPKPAAQPAAPRALANDAEMARFPGVLDRALIGGIIGLPGAQNFWGNTIIAQMRLDGSARSGSPLRIDGTVDGACTAPILLISEGAVVTGVIAAETIVVLGKVSGILAGRNVYVASTAQVDGEIYYQTMSIDPQAHCDVSFSRLPKEADPVELGSTVYAARAAA